MLFAAQNTTIRRVSGAMAGHHISKTVTMRPRVKHFIKNVTLDVMPTATAGAALKNSRWHRGLFDAADVTHGAKKLMYLLREGTRPDATISLL